MEAEGQIGGKPQGGFMDESDFGPEPSMDQSEGFAEGGMVDKGPRMERYTDQYGRTGYRFVDANGKPIGHPITAGNGQPQQTSTNPVPAARLPKRSPRASPPVKAPTVETNGEGGGYGNEGRSQGGYDPGPAANVGAPNPADPGAYAFGARAPTATTMGLPDVAKGFLSAVPGVSTLNGIGNAYNTALNQQALSQMGVDVSALGLLGGALGMNGYAGDVAQAMNQAMGTA